MLSNCIQSRCGMGSDWTQKVEIEKHSKHVASAIVDNLCPILYCRI